MVAELVVRSIVRGLGIGRAVGDTVEGTGVRIHLGELHMIVVSELTRDIIERALRQFEADGVLERRTLPRVYRILGQFVRPTKKVATATARG